MPTVTHYGDGTSKTFSTPYATGTGATSTGGALTSQTTNTVTHTTAPAAGTAFTVTYTYALPVNETTLSVSPVAGSYIGNVALNAGTSLVGAFNLNNATGATAATVNCPAATTNPTLVSTGAKRLVGFVLSNNSAATKWVRLFNKATAPVPGTDTPLFTVPIAAGTTRDFSIPVGVAFSLGLGYAVTGAAPDNDATAVAVNDVTGVLAYL